MLRRIRQLNLFKSLSVKGSLLVCLFVGSSIPGASEALAVSLIERSPFTRPDFNPLTSAESPTTIVNDANYEFHGVYELGENTHVLLKSISDGQFEWYTVGTGQEGLLPKRYDAESNELVIVMNNDEIRLTLQELGEFRPIPVASAGPSNRAATRNSQPALSRRSSVSGRGIPGTVASAIRRIPRSPTGSLSSRGSGSQVDRKQMQAILNSTPREVPRDRPEVSEGPESKPPRGAPDIPINFPTPPRAPGT